MVDTTALATGFSAALPDWVLPSLTGDQGPTGSSQERMALDELVVNWRPCAMCFGAELWPGLHRLVVAGDGPELGQLTGFDEGPVVSDWADQHQLLGIQLERSVVREGAIATYPAFGDSQALVYHARRG